ncbi:MAG: sigma factor-like helix-turn-helix DNA-binding protein [Tissierellia bacterium]|nr:sigma factor-like helix-turn-helix DNA-binding protein [Tissierellia bacterium]
MKKREYVLYVNGELVEVTKEVYDAFYKARNREKYLERRDRKHGLLYYNQFDSSESNYEEYLEDKSIDVHQVVETKLLIEQLYEALDSLTKEERELVYDLFFKEQTLREAGQKRAISHIAVMKRRDKILKRLREMMEEKK